MKKVLLMFLIVIVIAATAFLSLSYEKTVEPNTYYKVYLNGELLGKIESKDQLEKYINEEQKEIKEKYLVNEVFIPNGLEIKKEISYNNNIEDIKSIYEKIKEKSDFTLRGYQITIQNGKNTEKVYVLSKDIFTNAVEMVIKAYVGTEKYEAYKNNTQEQIKETGQYITDIYIDNNITIKEMNIPSTEKIYTDSAQLSKYLLFGENQQSKTHVVKVGDTIEEVAYEYKISVEEFLMSNPKYKKETNILSVGEEVVIGITNPKLNVTVSQETTTDIEELYKTVEKIDPTMVAGYETVTQVGKNGVSRTKQNEKLVNGTIVYVQQISKEVLQPATDKIIVKGSRVLPSVGSLSNWLWPIDSYYISSNYTYRINPITGQRELHGALDIAGKYGSKIYATNNGTVIKVARDSVNGIHVVINHNNGYYTQYNHMSSYASGLKVGQTVERGQVIGYVGMTGMATGPHLHFAVWYGGAPFSSGATRVNPWRLFR